LKRMMRTFPATPSLLSDQFTRMLPDSSGISVDDASLSVGHSAFVTLHGPHDVASDLQSLSAELDERRRQLVAERDEAWAPLDLATMVHHYVPRSASVGGMFIFVPPPNIVWPEAYCFSPVHPCVRPETLLTRYLAEYLTHLRVTVWHQKVKVTVE